MKQFWKENACSLLLKLLSKTYFNQSRVNNKIPNMEKTEYKKDFQKYHQQEQLYFSKLRKILINYTYLNLPWIKSAIK